jgi:hypothetical protein
MSGRVLRNESLLPIWRRPLHIVTLERFPIVQAVIAEDRSAGLKFVSVPVGIKPGRGYPRAPDGESAGRPFAGGHGGTICPQLEIALSRRPCPAGYKSGHASEVGSGCASRLFVIKTWDWHSEVTGTPATARAEAESVHRDLSQLTGLFGMFQCFG